MVFRRVGRWMGSPLPEERLRRAAVRAGRNPLVEPGHRHRPTLPAGFTLQSLCVNLLAGKNRKPKNEEK
jgi:hypothetical protein